MTCICCTSQLLVQFAASEGQLTLMESLGSKGCKLDELNPEGLAPLHVAAMRGDVAMVRIVFSIDCLKR